MKSRNLFIGIPIEEEAARLLEAIHFLGAIAEERVSLWEESLEKYSKLQSFSFHLTRFLAFPNSLEPRVLTLAGPIGNSPLSHLFYQMAETVEGVEVQNPIAVPITSFALYESLPSNAENRYRILKRYLLRGA